MQIGNAITEKMVLDVLLQARDEGLFSAVTDCGAGGFSSAVGEMGETIGAEVWLDRAPLKYDGLSYTEIWISEAQERMVMAVLLKSSNACKRSVQVKVSKQVSSENLFLPATCVVCMVIKKLVCCRCTSCTMAGHPPYVRPCSIQLPRSILAYLN